MLGQLLILEGLSFLSRNRKPSCQEGLGHPQLGHTPQTEELIPSSLFRLNSLISQIDNCDYNLN
jgi:hypothetical protein